MQNNSQDNDYPQNWTRIHIGCSWLWTIHQIFNKKHRSICKSRCDIWSSLDQSWVTCSVILFHQAVQSSISRKPSAMWASNGRKRAAMEQRQTTLTTAATAADFTVAASLCQHQGNTNTSPPYHPPLTQGRISSNQRTCSNPNDQYRLKQILSFISINALLETLLRIIT